MRGEGTGLRILGVVREMPRRTRAGLVRIDGGAVIADAQHHPERVKFALFFLQNLSPQRRARGHTGGVIAIEIAAHQILRQHLGIRHRLLDHLDMHRLALRRVGGE